MSAPAAPDPGVCPDCGRRRVREGDRVLPGCLCHWLRWPCRCGQPRQPPDRSRDPRAVGHACQMG